MSDNKGLTVAVLQGANAPSRKQLTADSAEPQPTRVEVVNEAAAPQPGGARPDGWAADAPLPAEGGERHAQPQQRESVRSATAEQLAQTSTIKVPRKR